MWLILYGNDLGKKYLRVKKYDNKSDSNYYEFRVLVSYTGKKNVFSFSLASRLLLLLLSLRWQCIFVSYQQTIHLPKNFNSYFEGYDMPLQS